MIVYTVCHGHCLIHSTGRQIEKDINQYLRDECGKLPQLDRQMNVDLKSIATTASTSEILKVGRNIMEYG